MNCTVCRDFQAQAEQGPSKRHYSASLGSADRLAKAPIEENGYFPRTAAAGAFSCTLVQPPEAEEMF
jgi:hypothetical protein